MKEVFLGSDTEAVSLDNSTKELRVEIGVHQSVVIDKLYGPLVMCDVRVRADFKKCQWVVERQRIREHKDGCASVEYDEVNDRFPECNCEIKGEVFS